VACAVVALISMAAAGLFDRIPLLTPALVVTVETLAVLALVGSWISRRRSWLALEASRAGLRVHLFTGVSGHNWQFASAAFAQVLPSLCIDLGLTGATR
jgi:hypothetical protein